MPAKLIDLTGKVFGKITAINYAGKRKWNCFCECGNRIKVKGYDLTTGHTMRCKNCSSTKHGYVGTATYNTWRAIVQRTQNKKAVNWKWYGGKGIKLSVRWLKFENFLSDMGPRPEGTTLDRIFTNRHYIKSNCRWADSATQAANKGNEWKPFETDITF